MLTHEREKRINAPKRPSVDVKLKRPPRKRRDSEIAAKATTLSETCGRVDRLHERLARIAREQRRCSIVEKNAAWAKERAFKKKLLEAKKLEEKMLMEEHNAFLEAKRRLKEQQELQDKQERAWRAEARERERVEEEFRRVEDLSRRLDILEEGMMRSSTGSSSASSSEDSFLAEHMGHDGGSDSSSIGFGIPGNWSVQGSVDSFMAQCLERARRPWV
ncbi:unnamed protein product [Ascophyllum nodosum]